MFKVSYFTLFTLFSSWTKKMTDITSLFRWYFTSNSCSVFTNRINTMSPFTIRSYRHQNLMFIHMICLNAVYVFLMKLISSVIWKHIFIIIIIIIIIFVGVSFKNKLILATGIWRLPVNRAIHDVLVKLFSSVQILILLACTGFHPFFYDTWQEALGRL